MLKGWFEHDGHNMDFQGYRNDGPGGGGGGWYSSDGDVMLHSQSFLYNLILEQPLRRMEGNCSLVLYATNQQMWLIKCGNDFDLDEIKCTF